MRRSYSFERAPDWAVMLWLQQQIFGFHKILLSFSMSVQVNQCSANIEESPEIIWLDERGIEKVVQRLIVLFVRFENVSGVVVQFGIGRIHFDARSVQIEFVLPVLITHYGSKWVACNEHH